MVPRSVVLIEGETLTVKSDAVFRILRYLPFPWPLFSCLRWVPRPMRDGVYDLVARYRYRVFGKKNACRMPAGDEREQFLDGSDQIPQRSSKKR
jgi:predicted DCC family thiol-disulfide oxidoreductase YuxK